MKTEERAHVLAGCDDETAGAVMAGAPFLSGMSEGEKANFVNLFRVRRFPVQLARVARFRQAIEAVERAGTILMASPIPDSGRQDRRSRGAGRAGCRGDGGGIVPKSF